MNERNDKQRSFRARIWGVGMTLVFHIALVALVSFSSLTYLYPPPEEKTLLIEFDEIEPPKPEKPRYGTAPKTPKPDPKQEVKIVKAAEAQEKGSKQNEAMESTMGDEGDVEKYEPPRRQINRQSLTASADNEVQKDTLAPQTAFERSDQLSVGHAEGNSKIGVEVGAPNARLEGRNVQGLIPPPDYNVQEEGVVVVKILVNQRGEVTQAIPGAHGTTATNTQLWRAARNAAMKTHFNESGSAAALQEGTITYIFKLK